MQLVIWYELSMAPVIDLYNKEILNAYIYIFTLLQSYLRNCNPKTIVLLQFSKRLIKHR